jgi:hypothetical protein
MFKVKRALVRFILPSAAAVFIVGLALALGQFAVTPAAAASPAWGVAGPAAVSPAADDHRYYDKEHKDYHTWSDREDHAYREWLRDQHREYRTFGKLNRRDQAAYWHWRHEHPEDR